MVSSRTGSGQSTSRLAGSPKRTVKWIVEGGDERMGTVFESLIVKKNLTPYDVLLKMRKDGNLGAAVTAAMEIVEDHQ